MADGRVVLEIDADLRKANSELKRLANELKSAEQAMNATASKKSGIEDSLDRARQAAKNTQQEIDAIKRAIAENEAALHPEATTAYAKPDYATYETAYSQQKQLNADLAAAEKLLAKQNEQVKKLGADLNSVEATLEKQTQEYNNQQAAVGRLQTTVAGLTREQEKQKEQQATYKSIRSAIDNVGKSMKTSLKSILRWTLGIRSVFFLMRKLRKYIKEAVSAFAEIDTATNASLTSLKQSLADMKLAWGGAFAQILNAIAPILQRIIAWLTTAANAVQAFFAALSGKGSYRPIVAGMGQVEDSAKKAGGAAKDAENQLMGFDELNKLQEPSGGGGGGGGGGVTGDVVDIPQGILDKVQWLKDHFDLIRNTVITIGALILGWKLAKLLSSLGLIQFGLQTVLGIALTIAGAILMIISYVDMWKNGITDGNLTQYLVGLAAVVVGLLALFGPVAAGIAAIVGGVALLVVGIKEWIATGELTDGAFKAIVYGITLIGGALALLTGSWIPALIAAIAMIVMLVIKNWDSIKAWLSEALSTFTGWVSQAWNTIIGWISKGWSTFTGWVSEAWRRIIGWLSTALSTIVGWFSKVIQKVKDAGTSISNAFTKVKDKVVGIFESIKDKIATVIDKVKEFFKFDFKFPHINLPHLTVTWQPVDNVLAEFLGITKVPHLGISWYAKGGVVNGATLIGAGEKGAEAIVPLERNTQWIKRVAEELSKYLTTVGDLVSDRMPAVATGGIVPPSAFGINREQAFMNQQSIGGESMGNPTISLYIDGKQIYDVVAKYQRRDDRAGGR